ncbi:hypothetical protein D3C80_1736610 [compost metagenome]
MAVSECFAHVSAVVQTAGRFEVHPHRFLAQLYMGLSRKTHLAPPNELAVVEITVIARKHHFAR